MKYKRILNLDSTLKRKSVFLFGARQTGKSTLLTERYPEAFYLDLLKPSNYRRYVASVSAFQDEVAYATRKDKKTLIIIDEIQKVPDLLDEVHRLIEAYPDIRFVLTGSSSRKLKRSGVNMLGGRASRYHLHPITSKEYGIEAFVRDIKQILNFGTLPSILISEEPWLDLLDYMDMYLKEEIQQEAIVRSLDGFSRFLDKVALTNAEQVNFTQIGSDAQVPPRTVREYYHVLEDTLIGYLLPAFTETTKRKAMSSAKFYLFDPGITNALLDRKEVSPKSKEFGGLLEQLVFKELKAYLDYKGYRDNLYYWRSVSKFEVDFVFRHEKEFFAIEVKSTSLPNKNDFKGLNVLSEEIPIQRKICVCLADQPRLMEDDIEIVPLAVFLNNLWDGGYF